MTRQTSIDCYNQIKNEGLLSKRRLEVLEAVLENAPCTSSEAIRNHKSTFGVFGVSSRFTELRDLGVIYEKRVRECTVTGRNVIEWDLTDKLPVNPPKKISKKEMREIALEILREIYTDSNHHVRNKVTEVARIIKEDL